MYKSDYDEEKEPVGKKIIQRREYMECDNCSIEWIALMESWDTERLECPNCGAMVQVPVYGIEPDL